MIVKSGEPRRVGFRYAPGSPNSYEKFIRGHSSPSAKVKKKFGSDKHRRCIGGASEVERRRVKKFAFLTKKRTTRNNNL